jgi:hypothetical protein
MMMMSSGRAGGGATAGRYPFTASQWQELEHQALIYKCLASGKPIPSYLMPPLRRILDSALATSPSLAYPPQPSRTPLPFFLICFRSRLPLPAFV